MRRRSFLTMGGAAGLALAMPGVASTAVATPGRTRAATGRHNQLPDWLTTGVANGTISSSQLMSLLEAHIFTEVGRYRGKIWRWDVANEFFLDANPSGIN